jgi:hypothetical protein
LSRTDALHLVTVIEAAMTSLGARRPIFHSEADFQLALAWELQALHADAQLRLEKRVAVKPRVQLDILMTLAGRSHGLELKYLRSKFDVNVDGELFSLAAGAPDVDRYDALKDIVRLERLVSESVVDAGCAVLLTNVAGMWSPGMSGRPTAYDAFRLHEGRTVSGSLDWGPTAGPGTKTGRVDPIALDGTYELRWRPFSTVGAATFRYLLVPVLAPAASSASQAV